MKSLVDDVVVTCDKIVNIPENASISPNNGINYWFIAAVLCVCVCVCVCVFIIFQLLVSSDCKMSVTYLRCLDQHLL